MLKRLKHYPKLGLVILSFIAFIALGMPDGLIGIAWPSIRTTFSIPLDSIGMLLTTLVTGYLTSSFLSGTLLSRFGVGVILTVSCILTGAALIGFTLVPSWWMMVALGIIAGLGAGAIDAGLNTYVAAHFGEGLMQWLHASYGIGITLGPIIMTFSLTSFNSWQIGYRTVGTFQLILAVCFILTLPMWNQKDSLVESEKIKRLTDYKTPLGKTLLQSKVWLSILLFFIYTGAESSLGTWAYSLLIGSRGISHEIAALCTGSYWAAFTIGRILAGLYVKRIGTNHLVLISSAVALLGSLLLMWNPIKITNLVSIALIGFSIAPIFAAMMSATSRRVGIQFTANTIGMQMAAGSLGVAIIPGTIGVLARELSLEIIPVCLIILFAGLFILYLFSDKEAKTA